MVILNYNNISQYYCFYCIFNQLNAALVSIRENNFETLKFKLILIFFGIKWKKFRISVLIS